MREIVRVCEAASVTAASAAMARHFQGQRSVVSSLALFGVIVRARLPLPEKPP